MKVNEYVAKTLEEAKEKAMNDLNMNEEEMYIKEEEEAGGFLKGKKAKVLVLTKDEVVKYCREFISKVSKLMGIEVNMEAKKRENYIKINLFSNNNPILIGKMGRTMESLQTLIRSSIQNTTGFKINVILDVEDYKEKQEKNLEYTARRIAIEVKRTGIEAKLDPMNSYERRIVHNICNEVGGVTTDSSGEEPNRFITIRKKED